LARLGTGGITTVTGDLSIDVTQTATATALAGATAAAGSAAVGLALALTISDHGVTAAVGRNVQTGGNLSLGSSSHSTSTANGVASAAGAPGESTGGSAGTGGDDQIEAERNHADGLSGATGGPATPSAATSAGGVNVAAAVGVVVTSVRAEALIESTVTALTAGGAVELVSSANTDASSSADGSATGA